VVFIDEYKIDEYKAILNNPEKEVRDY